MFQLVDTFLSATGERVGWLKGFDWTKARPYNIDKYAQVWNGKGEGAPIMRAIHREAQKTCHYPEHRRMEIYRFIMSFVTGISLVLAVLGIVQLVNEDDDGIFYTTIGSLFTVLSLLLRVSGPLIQFCGKRSFNLKLDEMLEDLNNGQLRQYHIEAHFPKKTSKFCLCIKCFPCCFKITDRSIIQLYEI